MKKNLELSSRFLFLRERIKKLWNIRFLRFLVIGGVNTVFGYSVFAILILLNLHYTLSLLIAQVLGVLFNFNTTGRIVFDNKSHRQLFRFFGVYCITYILNVFALCELEKLNVNMLIAGFLMMFVMAVLSYRLNKRFVFNS